jgi:hypothetical protein
MTLPEPVGRPATFATLVDSELRTRVLAWTLAALRERRIDKIQGSQLTRCAAEFTKLANVQLEYAQAVGEKREVYTGALPSLVRLLTLLDRNLVDPAVRESARLRTELAPILLEARRRLHAARQ